MATSWQEPLFNWHRHGIVRYHGSFSTVGSAGATHSCMHVQATPGASDDEEEEDTTKEMFCFCFTMPRSHH